MRLAEGAAAGREEFVMHLVAREAEGKQRVARLLDHRTGPAQEHVSDIFGPEQLVGERLYLVAGDTAFEQRRAAFVVAAQHVQQREAAEIAILQVFQFLAEQDRIGRAIAIDQREAGVRLVRQRLLDHGQDRRDAGSCRDGDDMPWAAVALRQDEAALGRHDIENAAGCQRLVSPDREVSAIDALDGDAQGIVGAGADRVVAAHLLARRTACAASGAARPGSGMPRAALRARRTPPRSHPASRASPRQSRQRGNRAAWIRCT